MYYDYNHIHSSLGIIVAARWDKARKSFVVVEGNLSFNNVHVI